MARRFNFYYRNTAATTCKSPIDMQLELAYVYDLLSKTPRFHDCVQNSSRISICTLAGAGLGYISNVPQGVALGSVAGFSLGYVMSADCPSLYQVIKNMPLEDKRKLYVHGSRLLQGLTDGFI